MKKKSCILFILFAFLFYIAPIALTISQNNDIISIINISTVTAGDTALTDPLNLTYPTTAADTANPVNELIVRVTKVVLGFVGIITLCMFIYGGLILMTSGGTEDKVKKGKNILIWAVIGLFIVLSSYVLVHFFVTNILGVQVQEHN